MRWLLAVGLSLVGCTSVRVVQRDGCWVRRTERWILSVQEEIGPCARNTPVWAEDRLTRLAQECVAQADYRWQNRALAAWRRGDDVPGPEPEPDVVERCFSEASRAVLTENERLKQRLAEMQQDRDALRTGLEAERGAIRTSHARMTDYLGEAARRPEGSASATATATSDGSATTDTGSHVLAGTEGAPLRVFAPMCLPEAQPKPARAPRARKASAHPTTKDCAPTPDKAKPPAAPGEPAPTGKSSIPGGGAD